MRNLSRLVFIVTVVTVSLSGCAPEGPKPPPVPPVVGPGGTGILVFVLIVAVGYFVWHKLNVISTKLDSLEKEIKDIKSKIERVKQD